MTEGSYAVELREWLRRNELTEAEAAILFGVPRSQVARWVREGGVSDAAVAIIRGEAPTATTPKKRNAGFYIYNMRCDLDRAAQAVFERVGYEAKCNLIPFVEPTSAVLTVAHPAARGSGFPALRKSEAAEALYRDKAISQLEAAQTFLPAFPTDEIELRTLCQDAVDLARLILRLDVEFLDQKYEGWALKISDDLKAWTDAYEARA